MRVQSISTSSGAVRHWPVNGASAIAQRRWYRWATTCTCHQITRYFTLRPRVRAALPPQVAPCSFALFGRRTCLRRAAPGSGTSLTAETLSETR